MRRKLYSWTYFRHIVACEFYIPQNIYHKVTYLSWMVNRYLNTNFLKKQNWFCILISSLLSFRIHEYEHISLKTESRRSWLLSELRARELYQRHLLPIKSILQMYVLIPQFALHVKGFFFGVVLLTVRWQHYRRSKSYSINDGPKLTIKRNKSFFEYSLQRK